MITLTTHQQQIFNNIVGDIATAVKNKNIFIGSLTGPAGTGKTVLTSKIIEHLLTKYKHKPLRATAPTHKALGVLSGNLNNDIKENPSFSYSTLHSFLKLKMKTEDDRIIFIEDPYNKNKDYIKILVVDESSMVSSNLFKHIIKKTGKYGVDVVLFIGDKIQLLPVEDNQTSPVYSNITQYELTEVVRQAKDNEILSLATELRESIETSSYSPLSFIQNDHVIIYNDTKEWVDSYINNPRMSESILAAFTNNTVIKYNTYIRNILKNRDENGNKKFPEGLPKLMDGDIVVFQEAYSSDEGCVNNGEIVEVNNPILKTDISLNLKYWEFKYQDDELENELTINVIDSSSEEDLKNILNSTAAKANYYKMQNDGTKSKKTWKEYWDIKKRFIDIKYSYAYTVHKLQGSTYDEVYINYKDILQNSREYEILFRLLYVALTRAKYKVHILV